MGWTMEELNLLLEQKGEDVIPFDASDEITMLGDFMLNGMMDFVDFQTGEPHFDCQEFRDILELCKRMGNDEENQYIADTEKGLREGKILLKSSQSLVLSDIQVNRQIFGENITYIGYPNKDRQGSYFEFPMTYGIYSKSEVQAKAWEFLRFVMTEEYQTTGVNVNYYAMPTRQDSFDLRIEALTATEVYTDKFGREIEPREKETYMGIESGPIAQEDVDTFLDLVNHTEKRADFDEKIMDIVSEEVQPYFEGDRSLEQTINVIQNRVRTYINENQ